MRCTRTAVSVLCSFLLVPMCRADDLTYRSLCEVLNHREQYNGKNIIVVGRFASSTESSYLIGDCGPHFVADGHKWRYEISLGDVVHKAKPAPPLPSGFSWSPDAMFALLPPHVDVRKLRTEPDCGFRSGWTAVFGRFETHEKFPTWTSRDGRTIAGGFGHLGESPAQIVYPRGGKFCLVSNEDKYGPVGIEPERMLWLRIRSALSSPGADQYFKTSMKDQLVPGGAKNIHLLKGTIISAVADNSPQILMVGIFTSTQADARLELDRALPHRVSPGTQVAFQGVATKFTSNPVLVTFKVSAESLILHAASK